MKKYLAIIFTSLFLSANLGYSQVGSALRNIGEEILEVFTKKGAKELAEIGGKEGLEQSLKVIAKEGGETAVERTLMYSKIYGSSALNAIKASPKKVTQALDSIPSEYKRNLISIVNKNPSAIANRLDNEGIDFLRLEAKFPSMGSSISKLGTETSQAAFDLSKKEAATLARYSPCLEAAKKADPSAYSKFLTELKNAPAKTVKLLNDNPNFLLAGTALTAFIASKNELFREGGFVEETITKPTSLFTYCIAILAVIFLGIKFYPRKELKKEKAKN
ncbi:MAG: hypothetical protein R3Y46_08285 [Opitutales bacterium]